MRTRSPFKLLVWLVCRTLTVEPVNIDDLDAYITRLCSLDAEEVQAPASQAA